MGCSGSLADRPRWISQRQFQEDEFPNLTRARHSLICSSASRQKNQRMSKVPEKKRRLWQAAPGALIVLIGFFSLFTIYRNQLFHLVSGQQYWRAHTGLPFSVSVSWPRPVKESLSKHAKVAVVKVSVPFDKSGEGCEFLYGTAVYKYAPEDKAEYEDTLFERQIQRFVFKFKYDHKNNRCESKDLSISPGDKPEKIVIQLVQVDFDGKTLTETPLKNGMAVILDNSTTPPGVNFSRATPPQHYPYQRPTVTSTSRKFSTNLEPEERELLVMPSQSLLKFILSELEKRTEKCSRTQNCDRVRIAVAFTGDRRILGALEKANASGMHVDWIENAGERNIKATAAADRGQAKDILNFSPQIWLRGNPYFDEVGFLPMHMKFAIFGEDMVVSAGANYDFERWPNSRDLAIVYRSPKVAQIFGEIFTMVRTSFYYPVTVDLNDNFSVLFNADRPRGYSAFSQKPFLSITTNEGISSSAYGILFEILHRSNGPLTLAMSPLKNSCDRYSKRLCFYDELARFTKLGKLKLFLNYSFYKKGTRKQTFRGGRRITASAPYLELARLVLGTDSKLFLLTRPGRKGSYHHERVALLGERERVIRLSKLRISFDAEHN